MCGTYSDYKHNTSGHINRTYVLTTKDGEKERRYTMQAINTSVFKNPAQLVENIENVTSFLREKIRAEGGDPARGTLRLIRTTEGDLFYKDADGISWRMYDYIDDVKCCDQVESPALFFGAGKAFGHFQRLLADYPAEKLFETIPHFHDTVSRLADFRRAVEEDRVGRKDSVRDEIARYLAFADRCDAITSRIADGSVPLRVTHNDTKLNNILLDPDTMEGVCIIDLDTVMPGSALYDFGDSIRFGANNAAEDEKDLSKVYLRLDLFEAFTKGFLSEVGNVLTETEIGLLPMSGLLMTLECGMRFLGDYLNGDVYFGIKYPEHNLDRARTQIGLVEDMDRHMAEMNAIVAKYRN